MNFALPVSFLIFPFSDLISWALPTVASSRSSMNYSSNITLCYYCIFILYCMAELSIQCVACDSVNMKVFRGTYSVLYTGCLTSLFCFLTLFVKMLKLATTLFVGTLINKVMNKSIRCIYSFRMHLFFLTRKYANRKINFDKSTKTGKKKKKITRKIKAMKIAFMTTRV